MLLTVSALFFHTGDRLRQTENRATRCKVERLQLLMQQKRLRRKARRDQRAPYQWLPNRRSGRSSSNSSMSSEGSLDLDFDDSAWKHDVKADLNPEYVMAWAVGTLKMERCVNHVLGFIWSGDGETEYLQEVNKQIGKERLSRDPSSAILGEKSFLRLQSFPYT